RRGDRLHRYRPRRHADGRQCRGDGQARARAQDAGDRKRRHRVARRHPRTRAPRRRRDHRRHRGPGALRGQARFQGSAAGGQGRLTVEEAPARAAMGLAKRIIPCLDVAEGRVVKGINFVNLRDAGDPVEVARRYDEQGADELAFLDIRASVETRGLLCDMIGAVADQVFIPLTVGGGVASIDDIRALLNAGADKVSINTAGVKNPGLFDAAAGRFGAQCIVAAIDAKQLAPEAWQVYTHGGRTPTGLDVVDWAREGVARGAGEILLSSMDRDGARAGFDLSLTRAVVDAVDVPVIASGGVGSLQDLVDGIAEGGADAVLAASIFHYGEHTVREAKAAMAAAGIEIRPTP